MSHESKPILLVECSTRKETQRPSLARSLAAGHKWRACSQANTHALVKPCKYNQDISQQYGTNICNQCKRSTCRSWRVTQVVLATSELATCYESSDIHQSARCKEESKVHPDENKLCNAAPTNTYQTEQISLYVQNLWLTCELIHQKREQENDFRLCSFETAWNSDWNTLHMSPCPNGYYCSWIPEGHTRSIQEQKLTIKRKRRNLYLSLLQRIPPFLTALRSLPRKRC